MYSHLPGQRKNGTVIMSGVPIKAGIKTHYRE